MPDAGPGLRAPNGCRTSLSGGGEVNIGGLEPATSGRSDIRSTGVRKALPSGYSQLGRLALPGQGAVDSDTIADVM